MASMRRLCVICSGSMEGVHASAKVCGPDCRKEYERAYHRAYELAHLEERREQRRIQGAKYRAENGDAIRQRRRLRVLTREQKDRRNARGRARRSTPESREKRCIERQKWRAAHPEKAKQMARRDHLTNGPTYSVRRRERRAADPELRKKNSEYVCKRARKASVALQIIRELAAVDPAFGKIMEDLNDLA